MPELFNPVTYQWHELRPFSPHPTARGRAGFAVVGDWLRLHYEWVDLYVDLDRPNQTVKRCDGLWRKTCFEAFLAHPERSDYCEWNLAPSGDWAFYYFRDYRGQPSSPASAPPHLVRSTDLPSNPGPHHDDPANQSGNISIAFDLPIHAVREHLGGIDSYLLGICSVICDDHGMSYWALQHNEIQPDFHDRRSYLARLR